MGPLRFDEHAVDLPQRGSCAATVYFGDADVTASAGLIQTNGWEARMLDSLEVLFDGSGAPIPSCLVLDVSRCSPGNLSFHRRLVALRPEMPIICTAGNVDVGLVITIMKVGVFDVLTKPIAVDLLLDSIRRALQHSDAVLKERCEIRRLEDRYASLSSRERQVMALIVSGLLNKQVGGELGISEITVKAHRGRLMRKMQARSFASLVKMAAALKL
jgi:FixJ family two-component response regulator